MVRESVKVTGQRVARRIKELRHARSLTLSDLADRLAELDRSYTLSTLSRIEQGKRRVDTDDLIAIALALDVAPNAILFPADERREPRTMLTANLEADTAEVLRWAGSGDTASIRGLGWTSKHPGPVHRSILAVDIESFGRRTNPDQADIRRALYGLLERTLHEAGIAPQHVEPAMDRGDGMLILIRPHDDVPKTDLITRVIPKLTTLLAEHNATVSLPTSRQLRLRAVVHAGEVYSDGKGVFGEDLDLTFRLLDSPEVKKTLGKVDDSSLVLVVSDAIYESVVRHGYGEGSFEPRVRVNVAGVQRRGWVHIPSPADRDRPPSIRKAETSPKAALG